MGAGLRTIQSNARSYTNRTRRDTRVSQKTRAAQAEAGSAGAPGPASGPLPVGSEFGMAFASFGSGQLGQPSHLNLAGEGAGQSSTSLMPPPPFMRRTNGPALSTRLPPMVLAPQPPPFQEYRNGDERSMGGPVPPLPAGLAPEPPPLRRGRDGQGGNRRGPG